MMDWQDLRFFLAIAQERTLSGAARILKVDQSTVGRRLLALEEAAGVRVFDRTPSGYLLTPAGEAALELVGQIEANVFALEQKWRGQDSAASGHVRLATSDSFAAWFVIPRLHLLQATHPAITIELVTGNQPVSLARREADISLRLSKPTQPNLLGRCIGRAAWALYASEEYLKKRGRPSLRNQLEGHDVVGFDDELRGTIGARWLHENAPHAHVAFCSNSLLSQAGAVVAGLGVSPLPCLFGDPHPNLRRIVPDLIGDHEIWLVVHPDVSTSTRVRIVLDALAHWIDVEAKLLTGKGPDVGAPARMRPSARRRAKKS